MPESLINDFVRELRALVSRYKLKFVEVLQSLALIDREDEEARRKAMMEKK
jgi:hypothetical protein